MTVKDRSRGWLITIPVDIKDDNGVVIGARDEQWLIDHFGAIPWMGQQELGHLTGYKHFQIWVECPNAIRFTTIKKKLGDEAHIEVRNGSKADAFNYCSKEDTRVDGPYYHGLTSADAIDKQGARSDLYDVRNAVFEDGMSEQDILNDPDLAVKVAHATQWVKSLVAARDNQKVPVYHDVKVYWVYGLPGVGKTDLVYKKTFPDAYRVTQYKNPFDEYSHQSVVIFDEFVGQIDFDMLMNLLDGYKVILPRRYMNCFAQWNTVVIISNLPPSHSLLYQNVVDDRWPGLMRRIETGGIFNFDREYDKQLFSACCKASKARSDLEPLISCCHPARRYKDRNITIPIKSIIESLKNAVMF